MNGFLSGKKTFNSGSSVSSCFYGALAEQVRHLIANQRLWETIQTFEPSTFRHRLIACCGCTGRKALEIVMLTVRGARLPYFREDVQQNRINGERQ